MGFVEENMEYGETKKHLSHMTDSLFPHCRSITRACPITPARCLT